jgi:hypothetical protein
VGVSDDASCGLGAPPRRRWCARMLVHALSLQQLHSCAHIPCHVLLQVSVQHYRRRDQSAARVTM